MRPRLAAAAAAAMLALTACATLPDSGPVHTRTEPTPNADEQAPYFAPPGPARGDTPTEVVSGFLTAMQANPPGAEVARRFLSRDVRETWNPGLGTIIYEAAPVRAQTGAVQVRFSDVQRLDARGSWVARPPGEASTLTLRVVREDGEWKIADPPDALAVPRWYFATLFEPFDLHFYDQTRRVLVPQRIYLPTGAQTATNLARRLLLGPGGGVASVTRTAIPAGTMLELGVVVGDAGVAEVQLSAEVLRLSPQELDAAVAQFTRTLRQVPGIRRLRLTVDGTPVPLPGGRTDVSVDTGFELDPATRVDDTDPVLLRAGRLVRVDGDGTAKVAGPLGRTGFALRSIAVDGADAAVAAVGAAGRTVYVAPMDREGPVRTVLDSGRDVLRPAYDMFGTLWLVDRSAGGARVYVVEQTAGGPRARGVQFPGVSGRAVAAFTVTGDGTRLVVALVGGAEPRVLVAPILRGNGGHVEGGAPPRRVYPIGSDLGPARDIGLSGPTTIAVLIRRQGEDQVAYVELDGAPGGPDSAPATSLPQRATALVAGPFPGMPLAVLTESGRLLRQDGEEWPALAGKDVAAAAYPR